MDWLLVLPGIDQDLTASCMASMRIARDRVIVVDNAPTRLVLPWEPREVVWTNRNMGVSASWNEGARRVVQERRDMLILCSQAILFGHDGARDLIDQLHRTDGHGLEVVGPGWHLVCFHRSTLERCGPFDEGFYPGYFEDTSYLVTMARAGLPSPRENGRSWPYVVVDHQDRGSALAVHYGLASPDFPRLAARYCAKWGGDQGHETFATPWNRDVPLWWWPDAPYDIEDPWGIGACHSAGLYGPGV